MLFLADMLFGGYDEIGGYAKSKSYKNEPYRFSLSCPDHKHQKFSSLACSRLELIAYY